MGFSKMLELLQVKDRGSIILCNAGKFYIARGKDALLLNKLFGLKVTCMETEVCKVGFPITSLEKYEKMIEKKNYSYIIYNFNQKESKLEIVKQYEGKHTNKLIEEKQNCYVCTNTTKSYKKHDKYIEAVAKLYETEKESKNEEEKDEKPKTRKRK